MKKIAMVILACSLSACSTMSTDECKMANWKSVGFSDATDGKAVQLSGHSKACAKVSIQPNRVLYMSGYNAGAKQFCNYQNGLQLGKDGRTSKNVCSSPALNRSFINGYNKGKKFYAVKQRIIIKENEIYNIDRKIRKIQKGKRKSSLGNLDLLYREKELINREIDGLRREQNRL